MPLGSEVRQFGHSGVITELLNKGWRVTVAAKFADDDLRNQLDSRVVSVPLIQESPTAQYARLHRILDRAHQITEAKSGKKQWKYRPERNGGLRRQITSWILEQIAVLVSHWPSLYVQLLRYEQYLETKLISPAWMELFRKLNPSVLVLNVPNVNSLVPALATAKAQNIPRLLLFHTSKDVAVNGRLGHGFTRIGVWNEWMKQELLRKNRDLISENIVVVGCAHFDCVGRKDLLMPEPAFRRQISAKPKSKLILFPASAPWVVPDEGRYVWLLVEAIRTVTIDADVQIVIRKNPMDETAYWENEFAGCEHVLVLKSDWRWDAKPNWCFQRRNDMILYNSLLHYSAICVGAPSTVTIECAISHLPVINMGFDLAGAPPLPGSMRAFWDADFNKDIVRNHLAILSNDKKQLLSQICQHLEKRDPMFNDLHSLSSILGVLPPNATKKYVEILGDVVMGVSQNNEHSISHN